MDSRADRWVEGYAFSAGPVGETSPLTINDGYTVIDGYVTGSGVDGTAQDSLPLTASAVNHVFLKRDGTWEVNTTGTAPSGIGSLKLYTLTTDGTNTVTAFTDLREGLRRVKHEAPFEADTLKATQAGENIFGDKQVLKGNKPYTTYHDTTDNVKTRFRAQNGKLQVLDGDTGTVLVDDLRNLDATLGDYQLRSEKDAANGYAGLTAGGLLSVSQLPVATEAAKGAGTFANAAPEPVGATGARGSGSRFAYANHVHAHGDRSADANVTHHGFAQISGTVTNTQHGDRAGGTLHALATQSAHGFLSSTDKKKMDDATAEATASTIVLRDGFGRFKAAAPVDASDVAIKSTVDAHANLTSPHSATHLATPERLLVRDAAGRAKVSAPSAEDDIALKSNVTTVQTNLDNHIGSGGTAHAVVVAGGAAGFMDGARASKLDGIEAGAEVNDVTSVFGRTGAVSAQSGDYSAHFYTKNEVDDIAGPYHTLSKNSGKIFEWVWGMVPGGTASATFNFGEFSNTVEYDIDPTVVFRRPDATGGQTGLPTGTKVMAGGRFRYYNDTGTTSERMLRSGACQFDVHSDSNSMKLTMERTLESDGTRTSVDVYTFTDGQEGFIEFEATHDGNSSEGGKVKVTWRVRVNGTQVFSAQVREEHNGKVFSHFKQCNKFSWLSGAMRLVIP